VDKEVACKSILIKGIIEDSGSDDVIPLPSVNKPTLEKILTFCEYITKNSPPEIEKPLRANSLSDVVSEWFANYVDLEQEQLFELILGANFMDIKPLLELACAKAATVIKGMTVQ